METTTTTGLTAWKPPNPGRHDLAKYIRAVRFTNSGPATGAIVSLGTFDGSRLPGNKHYERITGLGVATCWEYDTFDVHTGRKVALWRALQNAKAILHGAPDHE